jgi:carbamoyl-phosphate synthase large subunit
MGLGIIRSLRRSNIPSKIIAVDMDPFASGLYLSDHAYLVPPVNDAYYFPQIGDIVKRHAIQAIFVGSGSEVNAYAICKALPHGCIVFVSSGDTVAIAEDKWLTYRFLSGLGFPCPQSTANLSVDEVERFVASVGFPLILKPRLGKGSIGLIIARSHEELLAALPNCSGYVLQEYVGSNDTEYTVGTLSDENGSCFGVIPLRRYLSRGMTSIAVAVHDSKIEQLCAQVTESLRCFGPCNIQLRLHDDTPMIFEVNCRFSSSTVLRTQFEFNEPELLVRRCVLGENVVGTFRDGLALRFEHEVMVPLDDYNTLKEVGQLGSPRGNVRPV